MLQNSRVTAFIVFELLRENQLGGKITPPPTQISCNKVALKFFIKKRLKHIFSCEFCEIFKNSFCYKKPVAAFDLSLLHKLNY